MSRLIPKFKPANLSRLPPAKLPIFRNVINHPLTPSLAAASSSKDTAGPTQFTYTTSPRPLIPLTTSPQNHLLWNPPAKDDKTGGRLKEKDESGRLARFAAKFGGGMDVEGEEDLTWLEGKTVQSTGEKLGKGDIVGNPKSAKKGKK